jgi:hypothetical protein
MRQVTPVTEGAVKRYTDAEVVAWLTGGSLPVEHCFLAGDTFCFWDPGRGDLLVALVEDGEPRLHQACREYLRRVGAAFESLDAVRAEVRRRGLPGTVRFHVEVLALLGHPPLISRTAVEAIERCEAQCGRRLPAAIREWYSLEGTDELLTLGEGGCGSVSLDEFLAGFARGGEIEFYGPRRVNTGYQAFVTFDGSDDPPVVVDGDSRRVPFTRFVLEVARYKLTESEGRAE